MVKVTRKPLDYNPWTVIKSANQYTPDFNKLKFGHYDEFPVFIIGTVGSKGKNNHLLAGSHYYGKAMTYGSDYVVKKIKMETGEYSEPFLFDLSKIDEKSVNHIFQKEDYRKIEGEVYGVPLRVLTKLDQHFGNTDGVNRETCWVSLKDPIQDQASCKVFIYNVDLDYFLDLYNVNTTLEFCNSVTYLDRFGSHPCYYY